MFKLVTDNTSDLPKEYLQENNIDYMSLSYILEGVIYGKENEMNWRIFYHRMREEKMPTTCQINPEDAKIV